MTARSGLGGIDRPSVRVSLNGLQPAKEKLAVELRAEADSRLAEVEPMRLLPPARPGHILCAAVFFDEARRLPDFLRHYRELGVSRFMLIDTGSTDEGPAFLAAQPDVDLYRALTPYHWARAGRVWMSGLLRRHGLGHWCLIVDVDEHLVFDACETHGLPELVALLESRGRRSLPAFMIDVYPLGDLERATAEPGTRLIDASPLFDADSYWRIPPLGVPGVWHLKVQPSLVGGPRFRKLRAQGKWHLPNLAKTPFMQWDDTSVMFNSHQAWPAPLNRGSPTGCLLHFKLLADFREKVALAVEHGRYSAGSSEYRRYFDHLTDKARLSFAYEGSRRYESSASLVEAGLMSRIDWG